MLDLVAGTRCASPPKTWFDGCHAVTTRGVARLPSLDPKRSSALSHPSHGLPLGRGAKERQDVDVLTSIELEEVGNER
jgi:hypothetical protein